MPRAKIPDHHDYEAVGLKTAAAAQALSVSGATMERWRKLRIGPRFVQEGRTVIYPREELIRWLRDRSKSATASRSR